MSWPVMFSGLQLSLSEPRPADVLWVSGDADLLLRVEGSKAPFCEFFRI